ncbi:hypothetical protein MDA_GLEAN10015891 [Myotis davidii]|uniref:Uncharacterized protein n=1 Tax=Myotis davidii TaxID=225400 RepID=L5MEN0_MYODS|nr:hypothetical protein MDA_GLEAN10015891 [Myotis davidii]
MSFCRAGEKRNHITELVLCTYDTSNSPLKATERKQTHQPRRAPVVNLHGESSGREQGSVSHHLQGIPVATEVKRYQVALNEATRGLFPLEAGTRVECPISPSMQDAWPIRVPLCCLS